MKVPNYGRRGDRGIGFLLNWQIPDHINTERWIDFVIKVLISKNVMYDKTNIKCGCLICNELKLKAICLDRQKKQGNSR